MIFSYSVTTPALTLKTAPVITRMKLTGGVIHKMDIAFPPGAQNLMHVTIHDAIHQVLPTNAEGDFASDNEVISFPVSFLLEDHPFEMQIFTWNDDDTYPHTCLVRLGILPKAVVSPWLLTWRERAAFTLGVR